MDEWFIRLACLEIAADGDSEADCQSLIKKAQELYDWVMGITDEASDDLAVEYGQPYGIPLRGDLAGSGKTFVN